MYTYVNIQISKFRPEIDVGIKKKQIWKFKKNEKVEPEVKKRGDRKSLKKKPEIIEKNRKFK
jgi:hypothetical protein